MNISAANKRSFFLLFIFFVWFHQKICFWKIVCCFARKQFPFNLHTTRERERKNSCFSGYYGVQPKHCMPPIFKKKKTSKRIAQNINEGPRINSFFLFFICLLGQAVFYSVSLCYLWGTILFLHSFPNWNLFKISCGFFFYLIGLWFIENNNKKNYKPVCVLYSLFFYISVTALLFVVSKNNFFNAFLRKKKKQPKTERKICIFYLQKS